MSDERVEVETGASRRALFLGAGAVGATAVLAACGTEGTGSDPYSQPGAPTTGGDATTPTQTSSPDGETGDDQGDAEVLVAAGEVEVGGGVILNEAGVVVTQPSEGDYKGFSAACTHQGCIVSSISDGIINCACHGSQYSIADGSVVRAAPGLTPETQNPLPAVEVQARDGSVVRV